MVDVLDLRQQPWQSVVCSCPAVPGDNNGASLCDRADDQVLPILLLGVALAIACFLAAAHI